MSKIPFFVAVALAALAQSASAAFIPDVPDAGATGLLLASGIAAIVFAGRAFRQRK